MYECTICLSLNRAQCHHCQYCGTIPKQYSVIGKPANKNLTPVYRLRGAQSIEGWRSVRVGLGTVSLTTYAEAE